MKSTTLPYLLIIFLNIASVFGTTVPEKEYIPYEVIYNQLINLKADPSKTAEVSGLTIIRDVGTFYLKKGTLQLCEPINGRICAAIYIGAGVFSYTPPTVIEQQQLYRFYEKDTLNENFDYLFLMFGDTTLAELGRQITLTIGSENYSANRQISNSLDFLTDENSDCFNPDFMKTFLEEESNEMFYTHFDDNNNNNMFFWINPFEEEEVMLLRKVGGHLHDYYEVVNQFLKQERLYKKNEIFFTKDRFKITEYTIDSFIEDNLDFSSSVELKFTPIRENQHWIKFDLYSELKVDSVFWDLNERAIIYRAEDNSDLWIYSEEAMVKNNIYMLKIFYNGELLEKNEFAWISLKSPNNWYPKFNNRFTKAKYDLTFHYPSDYKFACIGDKVSEEESDDIIISRWISSEPLRNASFNIGLFDEYNIEEKGVPAVTVFMSKSGHNKISHYLAPEGILSRSNMQEQIGADVVNSYSLFSNLFGEISLKKIYATPIPFYHGEAFPGLIHLSWITYQGVDEEADGLLFRAHEIAHQWWGIGVDFKTYHDQWLSEGFSEYSGLWYVQAVLQDNDVFFKKLNDWKEQILSNRKYILGSGQEAGPIWLGYRTQSDETKGDYDLIIYKKGAWVLHMIRNMLLDIKTMNEDKFKSLLHDFFSTYRGKVASTDDFKRICEKYFNEDMSWFFNQWIYDTKIPEYTFSYKLTNTPDGKYIATCRVKQENVPENFIAYPTILIKFSEDRFARVRIKVTGSVAEFDLPLLPLEPEEIIFNDLSSVLCEFDYEDYE